MSKFLGKLIQYMLSAYFVLTIYMGIEMPINPLYYIATLLILALGVFLSSAILKFLTIKNNFITAFLMAFLVSFAVSFLFEKLMPGFVISEYTFAGFRSGSLIIDKLLVTPWMTMGIISATYSLIVSLLKVLEKSS